MTPPLGQFLRLKILVSSLTPFFSHNLHLTWSVFLLASPRHIPDPNYFLTFLCSLLEATFLSGFLSPGVPVSIHTCLLVVTLLFRGPTAPPGHTSLLRRNPKPDLPLKPWVISASTAANLGASHPSCSLPFQALWPLCPSNVCLRTFAFALPYVCNCPWAYGGVAAFTSSRSLLQCHLRAPPDPFLVNSLGFLGFLHSTEYVTLCSVWIYYLSSPLGSKWEYCP